MALAIKGFDQVTAWIGGVVLAGGIIGLLFFVGKTADRQQEERKEERAKEAEELLAEKSSAPRTQTESANDHAQDKHAKDKSQEPSHKEASVFSYTGASAPWRWSDMKEAWKLCGSGKKQSPVDISGAKINPKLKALKFNYQHGVTALSLTNQTVQGEVEFGSWLDIDGDRYDLKTISVHTPSEHRVNGLPYEMEIQFHHKELSGKIANVAVLITAGKSNPAILRLVKALPRYEGENGSLKRYIWSDILPAHRTYWQYEGSETTPPCTEGVEWIVLTNTTAAASREIDALANLQKNNSRPTQELGRRIIRRSNR